MGYSSLYVLGLFSLTILLNDAQTQDAMLTFEPNLSSFFTGESVMLTCDVRDRDDTDWYYKILKDNQDYISFSANKSHRLQHLETGHSGEYQCIGFNKHLTHYTKVSNKVSLAVSDTNVILEHPASVLYQGESVSLRCRHRMGRKEKNAFFYKDESLMEESPIMAENTATITTQLSEQSFYKCKFDNSEESKPRKLNVERYRPTAYLSQDKRKSPAGGNVTLTCSVWSQSLGWKYFWYRGRKTNEPMTRQDVIFLSADKISISQGGIYWCRGGRGNPIYYTEYSDSVVTNRAVVTQRPAWHKLYNGETVTLTCDIEDGADTKWEYGWALPSSYPSYTRYEYRIEFLSSSYSGDYRCMGRVKGERSATDWSDALTLTLSDDPEPVLTVSTSWLSSGDPLALTCSIKDVSAGWRFYWYKAVPKLSINYYSFELLPGSSNGTQDDSFTVREHTHTGGYYCTAGRGDPVYLTKHSKLKFVWSGDSHSAASLRVSPGRVQHLKNEPVSLSCEGSATKWKVNRFSKSGYLSRCSYWGTVVNGSTCNIHRSEVLDGVYWCESEEGQLSNAVNLTGYYSDIIIVTPVHPVAEGDLLTLGCRLKTGKVLSSVSFYKNGKLIQNNTRTELFITAVSKSDEGFYKCEGRHSLQGSWTSAESWVSVKSIDRPQSSPFSALVIVGLACGPLLIIFLILIICCFTKFKASSLIRSGRTRAQSSAKDNMIIQEEFQHKDVSTPLNDVVSFSESIKGPEEVDIDESTEVTYSVIALQYVAKKGKNAEPDENALYSNVTLETVLSTGKSSPVKMDETIYSEVKVAGAHADNT